MQPTMAHHAGKAPSDELMREKGTMESSNQSKRKVTSRPFKPYFFKTITGTTYIFGVK